MATLQKLLTTAIRSTASQVLRNHCKLPFITVARTQVSGRPLVNTTQLPTILPVRTQHKAPSEYCGKDQIFTECSKKKKFSDAYCRPGKKVEEKKVKKCVKRRGNYKKKK